MEQKKIIIISVLVFVIGSLVYGNYYANQYTPLEIRDDGNVIIVKNTLLGRMMWQQSPELDVSLSLVGDIYSSSYEVLKDIPGLDTKHAQTLSRVVSLLGAPGDTTIWLRKWIGEGYEFANVQIGADLNRALETLNENIRGMSYARFITTVVLFGALIGMIVGAFVRSQSEQITKTMRQIRGKRLAYKPMLGEPTSVWDFASVAISIMVAVAVIWAFIDNPSLITLGMTIGILFGVWGVMKVWNPLKLTEIKPRAGRFPTRTYFVRDVLMNRNHLIGVFATIGVLLILVYTIDPIYKSNIEALLILASFYLITMGILIYTEERKVPSGRFRVPFKTPSIFKRKIRKSPYSITMEGPQGKVWQERMKRYYGERATMDELGRRARTGVEPGVKVQEGKPKPTYPWEKYDKSVIEAMSEEYDDYEPEGLTITTPFTKSDPTSKEKKINLNDLRPTLADSIKKTKDGKDFNNEKAWEEFLKTKRGRYKLWEVLENIGYQSKREHQKYNTQKKHLHNSYFNFLVKKYNVDPMWLPSERTKKQSTKQTKSKSKEGQKRCEGCQTPISGKGELCWGCSHNKTPLNKQFDGTMAYAKTLDPYTQEEEIRKITKTWLDEKETNAFLENLKMKKNPPIYEQLDSETIKQTYKGKEKKSDETRKEKIKEETKKNPVYRGGQEKPQIKEEKEGTIEELKNKLRKVFPKTNERKIDVERGEYRAVIDPKVYSEKELDEILNHKLTFDKIDDNKVEWTEYEKHSLQAPNRYAILKDGKQITLENVSAENGILEYDSKGSKKQIELKDIDKIIVERKWPRIRNPKPNEEAFLRKPKKIHPRAGKKVCPSCRKVTIFHKKGNFMTCDKCRTKFKRDSI